MPPETPSSTRILLLSDTHGQLHPEILALARRADHVVHAGDIGHPDILAQLAGDGRHVTAVRGNNDMPDKWPAPHGEPLSDSEADSLTPVDLEINAFFQGILSQIEEIKRPTTVAAV